jgi:hypothetical protein
MVMGLAPHDLGAYLFGWAFGGLSPEGSDQYYLSILVINYKILTRLTFKRKYNIFTL